MSQAMGAAIQAGLVRPAILYEGVYSSGGSDAYLRLWTGVGTLSWNSVNWTGGGNLLSISPLVESGSLKANGFEVTLSGMSTSLISIALQSVRRNKPGKLWLALLDAAGAIIADPYLLKRGRFDMIPITENGDTCTLTARYEDRLVSLNTPRERRYTHEDQQLRASGDNGFAQVPQLQDATFVLRG